MIDDTYTGFIEVDTFDDEDAGYGTCSSGAQSINSVVSSPQEYLIENGASKPIMLEVRAPTI